jgi:hypothetical protein
VRRCRVDRETDQPDPGGPLFERPARVIPCPPAAALPSRHSAALPPAGARDAAACRGGCGTVTARSMPARFVRRRRRPLRSRSRFHCRPDGPAGCLRAGDAAGGGGDAHEVQCRAVACLPPVGSVPRPRLRCSPLRCRPRCLRRLGYHYSSALLVARARGAVRAAAGAAGGEVDGSQPRRESHPARHRSGPPRWLTASVRLEPRRPTLSAAPAEVGGVCDDGGVGAVRPLALSRLEDRRRLKRSRQRCPAGLRSALRRLQSPKATRLVGRRKNAASQRFLERRIDFLQR